MFDFLLDRADKSYKDLLENPKILENFMDDKQIDHGNDFRELLKRPGRCTSFAVQVVTKLEIVQRVRKQDMFDFEFFDLTKHNLKHRLARCKKTGILIDSSSSVGAFVLKEGSWEMFDSDRKFF